jgi:hypothetical protein
MSSCITVSNINYEVTVGLRTILGETRILDIKRLYCSRIQVQSVLESIQINIFSAVMVD